MEIVSGVAVPVVDKILTPAYTAIRYFICVRREVEDMRRLFDHLSALRNDINAHLQRRGRDPLEAVNNWMNQVHTTQATVEAIEADFALPTRCLRFCPDCCFRFQISRRIRRCKRNIEELTSRHGVFNGAYEGAPTQMLRPASVAEDNIVGKSTEKNKSSLKKWLIEKEDARMVGVWGMGGVGKTTLLTLIHNDDQVRNCFDKIFWVTVSREVNIAAIQKYIAKATGLEVQDNSTVEDLKTALYNNLLRKKFLLILDDMWEPINIQEDVGVPYQESKCKVVLSTRNEQVIRIMEVRQQHSIEVRPLSREEGWELFCNKAFSSKRDPSKIKGIAREIAKKCGGLPLAINAVARALQSIEDLRLWKDGLQAIKDVDPTFYEIHTDIQSRLIQPLKWSYDVLPPNLKICFLYLALLRGDCYIWVPITITHWMAEELIESNEQQDYFGRGYGVLRALIERCLVEPVDFEETKRPVYVKMHDIFHDLAKQIAKEEKWLLQHGSKSFPVGEGEYQLISMVKSTFVSLPSNFRCPTLRSLILSGNRKLKKIPHTFLSNIPSLRVLDLRRTSIKSLPASVCQLNYLGHLNLSETGIEELPENIGKLNRLQFLTLNWCKQLTSLPLTIGDLNSLKCLSCYGCEKLQVLPLGVSQLYSLEVLELGGSGIRFRGGSSTQTDEFCLNHMSDLRHLRIISLQIKSPIAEGMMKNWRKLRDLELDCSCGDPMPLPDEIKTMAELEQVAVNNIIGLPRWICEFQFLHSLFLVSCKELRELPRLDSLPELRKLYINGCNELRELGIGFGKADGFRELVSLWIKNLPMLERLTTAGEVVEERAMQKLKRLIIVNCSELKTLPRGMEKLKKLERLEGDRDWWDGIDWEEDDMDSRDYLQNVYTQSRGCVRNLDWMDDTIALHTGFFEQGDFTDSNF